MQKELRKDAGIQLLLNRYRKVFRIPENLDYYSKTDFKTAEKKLIKYTLMGQEA